MVISVAVAALIRWSATLNIFACLVRLIRRRWRFTGMIMITSTFPMAPSSMPMGQSATPVTLTSMSIITTGIITTGIITMGMIMFDDFFIRALFAGVGLAVIVGPLGCLIIWRQMAFFGDTLAHAALLGIALAVMADLSPMIGVPVVTVATCVALLVAKNSQRLSSDTILAILAHSTLAFGLVLIAISGSRAVNVNGLLFGDILAVSKIDLMIIYGGGALIMGTIFWQWRRL